MSFGKPAVRAKLDAENVNFRLPVSATAPCQPFCCPFRSSRELKEVGYIIYKTRARERGQGFVSERRRVPIFHSAPYRLRGDPGLRLVQCQEW